MPEVNMQLVNFVWHQVAEDMKNAFESLMENSDLVDVTLVCGDGQQVEAHKVILAASSKFFQKVLKRNTHPHPLLYLKGVTSKNLWAVLRFIYSGEVNIEEEELESFLDLAEGLNLRGLSRPTIPNHEEVELKVFEKPTIAAPNTTSPDNQPENVKSDGVPKTLPFHTKEHSEDSQHFNSEKGGISKTLPSNRKESVDDSLHFNSEKEAVAHIDARVRQMMDRSQNLVANEKR